MARRHKFFIIGVGILLCIGLVALQFGQNSRDETSSQDTSSNTEEESSSGYLSGVNPEDNYPVLQQAGIPHENDQFALAFKEVADAPDGIVVYAIDKTNSSTVSAETRVAVTGYLTQRGVDLSEIKLEYVGLEVWKSIQDF